ncbi:MAG: sacsin N-terminal ATP-binding-like domain-containing protein [Pseudonocardia sp.]
MPDPFETAALRAAVLDAWAASPSRFREDANAEEDLRLGGYADTWFVELAQNGADAARAGGVPGRLRVHVEGGELRVANTGAPLEAAGIAALASLRASAKRDVADSIGRFGVGFSAVLALSDAPRVVGVDGGVAFSAARTAAAVAALPGPAAELARRDGQLPVLRLAWPVGLDEPPVPVGYDTEVRLPLAPGADGAALLAQARAGAADLLLALPDLVEIAVGGATEEQGPSIGTGEPRRSIATEEPLTGVGAAFRRVPGVGGEVLIEGDATGPRRWLLARRGGRLDSVDTATLAVEQRGRADWAVCWALPLGIEGHPDPLDDDVLHAPTAAAERLALPARLLATVPLEPDRRRVRPGPVTDRVLAEAVTAYVELVRAVEPAHRLALVPVAGFPRSELDARLRELVLAALRAAAWLPAAGSAGPRPASAPHGRELTPGQTEWLDLPGADLPGAALPALLGQTGAFPGLLAPVRAAAALAELGVHRLGPGEAIARLLGVEAPAAWWRAVYDELAPAAETVPGLLDELRALPVPLADGRTIAGPATVLLPAATGSRAVEEVTVLALPGLHIAHPDAVHPLLARLGAAAADPAALLDHPALRAAVERSVADAEAGLDARPLAQAVLDLVAETGPTVAALAALALPGADGLPARADELLLPDAALRPLLVDDAPVGVLDGAWAARFPREVLTAVGVLDGFAVLVDDAPTGPDHDLDDEERWWDALDAPPARMVAVRDLDLIADDAWAGGGALALLAAGRATRAAVTGPHSYTAWWLARNARLGGHRPGHWRLPSATALATLYDPVPAAGSRLEDGTGHAVDEGFLAAIGVRSGLTVASAQDAADLLTRLGDPARHPDPALVTAAHAALAGTVAAGHVHPDDLDAPARVRALDGSVAAVAVAVVLDAPWLAFVLPAGELVAGGDAVALADLLDLPLASDVVAADVEGAGTAVRWSDLAEVVVTCGALGVRVPDGVLWRHDPLTVVLRRPPTGARTVPAWRDGTGAWHASDPVRALIGVLSSESDAGAC